MSELTPGQIAAGDQRIAEVRRHVARMVWVWRMTTYRHQCGPEGCGISADPARQALAFSESLQEAFEAKPNGFALLCEALAVAVHRDDAMPYCEKIEEDFRYIPTRIELLCQWLTLAVVELAKPPVTPPRHLWIAADDDARCSCGWDFVTSDRDEAMREWEAHAGSDCLVLQPWQQRWLEQAS
jgi:hypothetical protein